MYYDVLFRLTRIAAFCTGVVAGVGWPTSSGMRCFVAVVECFTRWSREGC